MTSITPQTEFSAYGQLALSMQEVMSMVEIVLEKICHGICLKCVANKNEKTQRALSAS